ncbi:MAG TPA: hypothetical protein DF383_01080, partial [Deltaproteobacteria bacterium]|nr:hypothetical protein [Deltaproteobacteria bacterium]
GRMLDEFRTRRAQFAGRDQHASGGNNGLFDKERVDRVRECNQGRIGLCLRRALAIHIQEAIG